MLGLETFQHIFRSIQNLIVFLQTSIVEGIIHNNHLKQYWHVLNKRD